MKSKRMKPVTAAELMEKLSKDKDYQARIEQRNKQIKERKDSYNKEQKELLSDLKNVGLEVKSVWDLVNTGEPYPAAIPVLLKHLRGSYSDRTKEGIARALAVPEAKHAWDIILEEFDKNPDLTSLGSKWGLGCALSVIAHVTKRYDETVHILRDKQHGVNRMALLDVLSRSRKPEIRSKLLEFADDPEIGKQARIFLKRFKMI